MPLKYGSELAEHRAVREAAGLFDLSHMGEVRISRCGRRRLPRLRAGGEVLEDENRQGQSTVSSSTRAAYILDDLITYRIGEEEFLIVPNASNTPAVVAALKDRVQASSSGTEAPGADVHLDRRVGCHRSHRRAGTELGSDHPPRP
jgi:aminomethyltransferase